MAGSAIERFALRQREVAETFVENGGHRGLLVYLASSAIVDSDARDLMESGEIFN